MAATKQYVVFYSKKTGALNRAWVDVKDIAKYKTSDTVVFAGAFADATEANKAKLPPKLTDYQASLPKPAEQATIPPTTTVPENNINGNPIPAVSPPAADAASADAPAPSSPSTGSAGNGGDVGSAPQVQSTTTPLQPSTPAPAVPTGSGTVTTPTAKGDFRGADINRLAVPTIQSLSESAMTVNGFIDGLNQKKAEMYALGEKYSFDKNTNLNDVFAAPAGTMFKMQDGSFVPRETLVKSNNFANAKTGVGSAGAIQLSQPLENYKALLDAGVPAYGIAVNPLPPMSLTEQPLPDFSSLSKNLQGTQVGRGAVSAVDTLQQMPNQSVTDVTGGSKQ